MTAEQPTPAPPHSAGHEIKPSAMHVEEIPGQPSKIQNGDTALALFENFDELHEDVDPGELKRLVRKIDFMILPFLAVCYAFYYVWALPTNFLMQKFPVGKYLGANIFLWGFFLMLQAAAKNFVQLAVLRVISGAAEACSDPAFMLITSMWYTRRQQPIRIGLWYTANGFGIALGGLLGYGIGHIKGALSSWKYEFLIIGALVTTLMQIPYGAFIALMILFSIWLNDRLPQNNRCYVTILFLLPNLAGSFGLCYLSESNKVGRLICYYLTGSYNASFVLILSILTANIAGHTKKVVTNAMIFIGVCAGNIAGPFFYKEAQAPRYPLGIWSMIVSHFVEILLVIVLRTALAWENRRRDRLQGIGSGGEGEEARQWEMDRTAFSDLTDKENLNFRYVY
ncbi:MFS allantoate transporter [Aspergillus arachidicola]|uniref:MFS allantoate transporter n=1 Tax=Aspergillus arachidicola TaxID=656916 RepID=A0A2G7G8L8_9EURO|nr:MFS allantoate transporter [Aspergillus arachidicola]